MSAMLRVPEPSIAGPYATADDLRQLVADLNAALESRAPKVETFTPRIVGTTLGGSGTYSLQKGWCVKHGQVVSVFGSLTWSAHTGTGNMRIAGLPYPAMSDLELLYRSTLGNVSCSSLTFTQQLTPQMNAGESVIRLHANTTGAAAAETAMDTAATLIFSMQYLTNS